MMDIKENNMEIVEKGVLLKKIWDNHLDYSLFTKVRSLYFSQQDINIIDKQVDILIEEKAKRREIARRKRAELKEQRRQERARLI